MSTPPALVADRYRLVRMLGAGGMGVVWEAWDERLHRTVALKMLRTQPELGDEERIVATDRALREARITAGLHHPHAVTVFDVVEHDGQPCIVMQLIESTPLSVLLREHGRFSPAETAHIGAQVASALAAAHKLKIVHRDVKPGNILIRADGSAMISDFGISHALGDTTITATGMIHGTPAYLAPEAARGQSIGFAADVFSLGSTLYAMTEGQPPFGTGNNPIALLHKVAKGGYPPPKHAGPLAPLLQDMLATQPKKRPTMAAVVEALDGMQQGDVSVPATVIAATAPVPEDWTTERMPDAPTPPPADAGAVAAVGAAALPIVPGVAGPPPLPDDRTTEAIPSDASVQPPASDEVATEPIDDADALFALFATPDQTSDETPEQIPEATAAAGTPDDVTTERIPDAAVPAVTEERAPTSPDGTAETLVSPAPRPGPPTAATLPAVYTRPDVSSTAETEPLVPERPAEVPAGPARPVEPGGPTGGDPSKRRRRRTALVAGILILLLVLAVGAWFATEPLRSGAGVEAESSPTPSTAASPTSETSPSAQATQPSPTPPAEAEPTEPAPPPPSAEQRVVDTIAGYYALMPEQRDQAWNLMTADYQENHAGGRGGYEAFWSGIADVSIADVSATGPDTGQATLTYTFTDGSVVQEVTSFRLVDEGGVLKIAATDVLSSTRL